MKIKTFLAFVLGAVALTTGCERKAVPGTSQPKSPGPIQLVIRYPSAALAPEAWTEAVQQFASRHSNIQVTVESVPGTAADQHRFYGSKFQERSSDFDLFLSHVDWVGEFAAHGWLRDLQFVVPPAERSNFFTGAIDAGIWDRRLYAVPYFIDGTVLYCRTDLLHLTATSLPRTWADFVRVASESKQQISGSEVFGFLWPGQPADEFVATMMEFLWGNGGQLLNVNKVVANSTQNRTTLGFVQGLFQRYNITPALVTTSRPENLRQLFLDGKALFLRDWAAHRQLLRTNDQVALVPLPGFPGHKPVASLDGWFLGINSRTRYVDASAQLLEYLISEPAMASLTKLSTQSPARPRLYKDVDTLRVRPDLEGLEKALAQVHAFPVLQNSRALRDLLAREFAALLAKTKTPDEVMAAVQAGMQLLIRPASAPGGETSAKLTVPSA
ncbi:MAG TPA: extracellular solute-binding protein [Verrucomicrobiae bacterium]|nr:extracellular solute-binding protein [Verrucomicrobiae bacterium]